MDVISRSSEGKRQEATLRTTPQGARGALTFGGQQDGGVAVQVGDVLLGPAEGGLGVCGSGSTSRAQPLLCAPPVLTEMDCSRL